MLQRRTEDLLHAPSRVSAPHKCRLVSLIPVPPPMWAVAPLRLLHSSPGGQAYKLTVMTSHHYLALNPEFAPSNSLPAQKL